MLSPPPPPKSRAPAPPKCKAPPPPPTRVQSRSTSSSTYDLGKNKMKSFGSKVKRNVKSFTKSELKHLHVGMHHTKQTAPPSTSRSKSYDIGNHKPKRTSVQKKKPKPPTDTSKKVASKNRVSSRVVMFENNDNKSDKRRTRAPTRSTATIKPKPQHRNLKPSMIKQRRSPTNKSKQTPPSKPLRTTKSSPLKAKQSKKGLPRSMSVMVNKPTVDRATRVTRSISSGPAMKKKKPPLPTMPVPMPKRKKTNKKGSMDQEGILEIMPTKHADGWIYNVKGMFNVSYKDNIDQIQKCHILEGSPVLFERVDKSAHNIRWLNRLDVNVVQECMTKAGKTRCDARYYVHGTKLEFEGTLRMNSFEAPKRCIPKEMVRVSEKIINAFMNTNGGVLYFGIDTSWNIEGVESSSVDLTLIKQCVMNKVATFTGVVNNVATFTPKLAPSDVKRFAVETVGIVTKEGMVKHDRVVVKIIVPGPFTDANGEQIMFRTQKGDTFRKNLNFIIKVII